MSFFFGSGRCVGSYFMSDIRYYKYHRYEGAFFFSGDGR